jgi:hypothetical protein
MDNPISGIFVRRAPNPIGSNNKGSNFLFMARYINNKPTRIITA